VLADDCSRCGHVFPEGTSNFVKESHFAQDNLCQGADRYCCRVEHDCKLRFRGVRGLGEHERIALKDVASQLSENFRFVCVEHSFGGNVLRSWKHHQSQYHTGVWKYTCRFCPNWHHNETSEVGKHERTQAHRKAVKAAGEDPGPAPQRHACGWKGCKKDYPEPSSLYAHQRKENHYDSQKQQPWDQNKQLGVAKGPMDPTRHPKTWKS
jgi:hypothetical protein